MPLYEYQCKECGVRFERQQSFKDAPLTVCPECGSEVHRVIGATGIIFKGSGFYVTDNRKSSVGSSHKPSPKSDNGGESKSEGASKEPASTTSTPAATE